MKEDIGAFFPELQAKASELYSVSIGIAAVLVLAGLILKIGRSSGDPGRVLWALVGTGLVAVIIQVFPDWINRLQSMTYSLVELMDADPSDSHMRFSRLISGATEPGQEIGFWDIISAEGGGIGKAMIYAAVLLASKVALGLMWLFFVVQQVMIQFQVALAPVFLAFFLLDALKGVAGQFMLRLVAVALFPLGWALADLMTSGLLNLALTDRVYEIGEGGETISGPQTLFFMVVVTIWIVVSTIFGPLMIWKLLSQGANVGSAFLSGFGMAVGQGAAYGIGAATTATMLGGSQGTALMAGAAGAGGGIVSGALGTSGVIVPTAIGLGAAMVAGKRESEVGVDYNARAAEYAKKGKS